MKVVAAQSRLDHASRAVAAPRVNLSCCEEGSLHPMTASP